MGSVRRADGHGRILAGRWLPLSIFNLDRELGYEPDMLAGLQVRKHGLTDALAEEGVLTLPAQQQDLVDALFWQRATVRQATRQLAGVQLAERLPTLAELLWEQWRDDPAGTAEYYRPRVPGWQPPSKPPANGRRPDDQAGRHATRQQLAAVLVSLRGWCEKWVEAELLASEVETAMQEEGL